MAERITPFHIEVPESDLDDLRQRLALTRLPSVETAENPWMQGVPLQRARGLLGYWGNGYSWWRCEEYLNRFNHYLFNADDVDIHFIHARSRHQSATPLLLTHGWPGSILEFTGIIDRLTDPEFFGGTAENAFHVVVPSLPGFGFSGKPEVSGWNIDKIARTWGELMAELGYDKYVAQGGGWGSMVTQSMAQQKLPGLKGLHLNLVFAGPGPRDELSREQRAALKNTVRYQREGMGYAVIQSTRPQTVGYGLADSPVGLAMWIYEKFHNWSDCGGDPESIFTRDQLLDNISLYWLTNSGHSSTRLFWESPGRFAVERSIDLPIGFSVYPKDIVTPCRTLVERIYPNLAYWNTPQKGGHFAAMEQPEGFVRELRDCFAAM